MFLPYKIDGTARAQSLDYLPCAAITPKVGLALTWSSGNLNKTGQTAKPDYICMTERTAAVTAGDRIPVLKVNPDIVFETKLAADYASIARGASLKLSSDGLGLAAETGGKAVVEEFDGKASGDRVRVRFV